MSRVAHPKNEKNMIKDKCGLFTIARNEIPMMYFEIFK